MGARDPASASGYDGADSKLLRRMGAKYRVWPHLSLCHSTGPGASGAPKRKEGRIKVPTCCWGSSGEVFQEASSVPKEAVLGCTLGRDPGTGVGLGEA